MTSYNFNHNHNYRHNEVRHRRHHRLMSSTACVGVFNKLAGTLIMIIIGLANANNGLTSTIASTTTALTSALRDMKDAHPQVDINQNLIMSHSPLDNGSGLNSGPARSSSDESGRHQYPSTAALTASSDMPYPPSSISGSSSLFHHSSGSSITSFDSTNVIDDKQHQQQHRQQQFSNQRQLSKHSTIDAGADNHLDAMSPSGGEGGLGAGDLYNNAPMHFGTENSTVVTTQIGATAHIPCTVHNIGDGVVSWIRKKDYHLLTVGLTTYSSDERFSATHLKHSEDWTLQIKFVQLRDAGVYECQVSTHPPTSIFLHLIVVEARAEISGPPIRYLTPGSTLRLQCRVVQNTEASEFIFWYHDNRMINYDIDRGINVSTEPDFQSSELTILRTRREHSGNYTCVASNTQPASVLVHIFKGDNPAAMYHGHVGSSTKSYQTHLHTIMVMLTIGYRILHTYVHIRIV